MMESSNKPIARKSPASKTLSWMPIVLTILCLSISSCIPQKKLTYLQEGDAMPNDSGYYSLQRKDYQIQINDILNISIRSYNAEVAAAFNTANTDRLTTSGSGDMYFYLTGYTVDNEGFIDLPVVGRLEVLGKTTDEVKDYLNQKLTLYFQEAAIYSNVQLSGIRFSIIGEVNRPGKYTIYQNQANIFEALSMAGDATVYGKRGEVQIIRQYPEGTRVFELDLTDRAVLSDPDFMIQPNDIINVKPASQRSWGIGTTGFSTFVQAISAVSSALLIVLTVQQLSN